MNNIYCLLYILSLFINYNYDNSVEIFIDRKNNILNIRKGNQIIYKSLSDNWIVKDSLVYEALVNDRNFEILETDISDGRRKQIHHVYEFSGFKKHYSPEAGLCGLQFDISPQMQTGAISIPTEKGYSIYSFKLKDTNSLKHISDETHCPNKLIVFSDKVIWYEFSTFVKVKSCLSDSILIFRDSSEFRTQDGVLLPEFGTLGDILALDSNNIFLKYDNNWITCDPLSFKIKSVFKPQEGISFFLCNNSQSRESVLLSATITDSALTSFSTVIYRFNFRNNKLEKVLEIPQGNIEYCSLDNNNVLHIYFISQSSSGLNSDDWIHNYIAYDITRKTIVNEVKQSAPFEYYRFL